MSDSLEIDYLKPFIESTIDASARFRRVLIVMVTVSILAFGAFWNSLDETWFNSRIAAARRAEAYLRLQDILDKLRKIENDLIELDRKGEVETEVNRKLELKVMKDVMRGSQDTLIVEANKILEARFHKKLGITKAEKLAKELTEGYNKEKGWIAQRMMLDKEQASKYVEKLEDERTANILLIHIPFSGSVFDVNSLGLWAGITFVVILLVFRFSLWREYNNLRLTFVEARPEHLRFCYRSLAMQQVLTVPPALSLKQPSLMPQGKVVQLLYFPPSVIQFVIVMNDIRTENIGRIFGTYLAPISTRLSMLLLIIIIKLTWRCLKLSSAIDSEWEVAAGRVREVTRSR